MARGFGGFLYFSETFRGLNRNSYCGSFHGPAFLPATGSIVLKIHMDRSRKGVHILAAAALAAVLSSGFATATPAFAQAPAAASANRALGTVKSISGTTLTVATDGGPTVTVSVADGARVQQSADLKTVSPSSFDQIAVGDRVLATGTAGDAGALTATRVIMIKSTAIAERNQGLQADWNRRGSGGIVTAVDPSDGAISISSGTRKITVDTRSSTIYRRYAPGSVKFEEAKPGTLADIRPGDQLRVRGDRSPDGLTVTAEEIVSGSFKNLSGTIVSLNAATNSLVVKDLATKKNETVTVSSESDVRSLPPEMAARFAPRPAGAGAPGAGAPGGPGGTPGAARPDGAGGPPAAAAAGGAPPAAASGRPAGGYGGGYGAGGGAGAPGGPGAAGGRPRGGAPDLAALIPRLPKAALTDLKPGQALMIVASGNGAGGPYTAITVLSGVEPLLTGPASSALTISPWSLGGGGGEGGAGGGAGE